jgi:hypothetical protein
MRNDYASRRVAAAATLAKFLYTVNAQLVTARRLRDRLQRQAPTGEAAFMQQDWCDLTYLRRGTATQQAAYQALEALRVFPLLRAFDPVLVGTIPLDIDIPGSDLDIVCYAEDGDAFTQCLLDAFGHYAGFVLQRKILHELPTVIAQFMYQGFPVEIFGQPLPVTVQPAFRHLLVEERLLRHGGAELRQRIRHLKSQGLKTEPAFATVLALVGDPYDRLLELAALCEEELLSRLRHSPDVSP